MRGAAARGVGGRAARPAPAPARSTTSRRSTAAAATRFDYRNEFSNPGGFLGRIAGRVLVAGVAEREANQSLQRLKALVERA